jgi:hypothetical protein
LSAGYDSYHVEQEDEQIVRLSGSSGERFFVDNFKVNKSRALAARIVDYILGSAVAVGPATAEMVAPKLMGAAKLSSSGLQHLPAQRSAIQHFKTASFPALPFFYLAPEPNRNIGHAKIEIREIGQLLAVKIAALNDNASPAARFLFDRIDRQRFDKSCRDVSQAQRCFYELTRCRNQRSWNEILNQRSPISQNSHFRFFLRRLWLRSLQIFFPHRLRRSFFRP